MRFPGKIRNKKTEQVGTIGRSILVLKSVYVVLSIGPFALFVCQRHDAFISRNSCGSEPPQGFLPLAHARFLARSSYRAKRKSGRTKRQGMERERPEEANRKRSGKKCLFVDAFVGCDMHGQVDEQWLPLSPKPPIV